tara:strand:- start:687 stop:848 length:162 start_codon:yes stop_codon:yes gene_type:complete
MISSTKNKSINNYFRRKELQIIINLLKYKFQNNLLDKDELELYIKIEKLINNL